MVLVDVWFVVLVVVVVFNVLVWCWLLSNVLLCLLHMSVCVFVVGRSVLMCWCTLCCCVYRYVCFL